MVNCKNDQSVNLLHTRMCETVSLLLSCYELTNKLKVRLKPCLVYTRQHVAQQQNCCPSVAVYRGIHVAEILPATSKMLLVAGNLCVAVQHVAWCKRG